MIRPKLFQVVPADDYKVYRYYDNGEIKVYACSWILYVIFEKRSVTNE